MKACWSLLAALPWEAGGAELPGSVISSISHGARGDGRANDAPAVQKAIDACARAGGGTFYFPTGNYLSGTIVLKNNVTLHLSPGATLWGSRGIPADNPLHPIYAPGAENIGIEGGPINGNGDAFWESDFKAKPRRPSLLIELAGCRNARMRDVRIRNTPGWGIQPVDCDGVFIRAYP